MVRVRVPVPGWPARPDRERAEGEDHHGGEEGGQRVEGVKADADGEQPEEGRRDVTEHPVVTGGHPQPLSATRP